MDKPFNKIGLAITFSPTGKALLYEAKRLQNLFNCEMILIHVGEKKDETNLKLIELLNSTGIDHQKTKIIWQSGDPAKAILKSAEAEKIDLLIAGALEQENLINYYVGSVARKIMREANCSVLIFTKPKEQRDKFKKFCVTIDFSEQSENALIKAHQFALMEKAEELILIREIQVPGLAMAVQDSGSTSETENARQTWKTEEEAKLKMLTHELNLKGVPIKTVSLYGKQGWEANKFVQQINGDILVVPGPKRKLNLVDRVFQHDLEFILKQLPCSLLIVR